MELPEHLPQHAHAAIVAEELSSERRRLWGVILGLSIARDGNQYCILWGENLQDGVCGFGDTPADALYAFEKEMHTKAPSRLPEKPKEDNA